MSETLKKISAAVLEDFRKAIASQRTADFVTGVKAAEGAGTFKVIISTSDEDRQGDSIDQSKWNLKNFESNPVVLWAHDYYSLPVGVCTKIGVEGGKLVAEGKFASADLNPFAGQVAALYEAGFIKTTSVGYMQHEDGELELLEFSFVPVPANPYALSMRQLKEMKLNMPQLVMKGIQFEAKSEAAGDPCTMTDGTAGVLAEDPDNAGQLICVPAAEKTAEPDNEPKDEKPEEETVTEEKKSDEGEQPADEEKPEDEKNENKPEEVEQPEQKSEKSGRAISAANKEKIKSIIKAVEDHHTAHGTESNNVIAALKDLMGPDEGNEGEEKPEKQVSPKPKVEVRGTAPANDSFEAIMAARAVLRTVDTVVGKALKDLNFKFRENYSARR
jgi:hypothetical protein